jgi:hypothetical protein
MRLFFALRALDLVQNFVALIDSRSCLMLAGKVLRVIEIADDAAIPDLRCSSGVK